MVAPSTAGILSIGDEIVLGQQADTNSRWLAMSLAAHGVMATEFRTVGDDRVAIRVALAELSEAHAIVVTTGGLGPTADDLTRTSLNDLISPQRPLVLDEQGERWLRRWFRDRTRPMPESNLAQAMRPEPATLIENRNGTAPGLAAATERCRIFCLPGPPREMKPMFDSAVAPAVRIVAGDRAIRMAVVRQVGLGESDAAERLGDLMARSGNPLVGTTASGGVVSARVRAEGAPAATERACSEVVERVKRAWAPYAFGEGDTTLADALHAELREAGATVALAESCTGGLLASMLIEPAGASDVVVGGWITYDDAMKIAELGVRPELLKRFGAVSREVASAMATAAVVRSGATFALATSGIAGPGGGSDAKPVGMVWIALADGRSSVGGTPIVDARCFRITGTRGDVRDRSARLAMQMLRLHLLGHGNLPLLWQLVEAPESTA